MNGTPPPTADNITGRHVPTVAVHRPRSVQDVVALVQEARERRAPLYPVSTGMNWGYGSRSPVIAGCELVDLGALDRIRNADRISPRFPVAVIEAGVTQGQLFDHLVTHELPLRFNLTGSARATSVLGNALDGGIGYFGPKEDDVFALEVVTGSGEVINTGGGRLGEASPLAELDGRGLGPRLDGLFIQGAFGIVTSASLRLRPVHECALALSLALRHPGDLPPALDALVDLQRRGVATAVTHLGNRPRTHGTLAPGVAGYFERACGMDAGQARQAALAAMPRLAPAAWSGLLPLHGDRSMVLAQLSAVRRAVEPLMQVRTFSRRKVDRLAASLHRLRAVAALRPWAALADAIRPLQRLAMGEPGDAAIDALRWQVGAPAGPAEELDAEPACGLLYVAPTLPADGAFAASVLSELEAIARRHGHDLPVTLNLHDPHTMVAIGNLLFDRRDRSQTDRAHRCADALLAHIHARGLEVYRARADSMAAITSRTPEHWQHVARLKAALDPDGIIAPGRYLPP